MSESIPPQSGRVIAGKYRIDSQLGEGAMGTVWTATHINLGQRVAVKLISPELADAEPARLRFDAEAKAAAALRSRFVVHIYDSGITGDGIPYLVMEYLTGESLEERVERGGPLALRYAVQVLAQVARGLARAHSMNIVHRDLKPANVFLAQTEDGEEVAKILDFGVAKIRREGPSQSATATGAVVGTPLFMSPEQARGLKTVDHRSDLYSLGMMAFWILTGQHAFSGEAFGDLILAICTQPLPNIHHVAPWLPVELDDWFKQACAREPDDRFDSAEEMIAALLQVAKLDEKLLHSVGVMTRLDGTDARFAMASSPSLLSDSGELPVPLVQASAVDTVRLNATATGLARSSKPRGVLTRPSAGVVIGLALLALFVGGGVIVALSSGTPSPSEAVVPRLGESRAAARSEPPRAASPAQQPAPEVAFDPVPEASVRSVPAASASVTAPRLATAGPAPEATTRAAAPPTPVPTSKLERSAAPRPRPPGTAEIDIGF
jgi:serine/threonine protein kinase